MQLTKEVVYGFVNSCLVKNFDGSLKTPWFHEEMWELCTSHHKYVAISAPRGHAKSTAITLSYGLATLLFRQRNFMLLVSDTESQACLFLGQLKQTLQDNKDIVELFGIKTNSDGIVQFLKETESDVIVEFDDGAKFRIIAKGAEQKLRGLLWNNQRPDIVICDDLENDEIVMNKERRGKFKRWFYGALMPCLSKEGVIRYVGTILHMDSMLENFMPNENDKQTINEPLKSYTNKRSMWKSAKYRAHDSTFEHILWPEKFNASELRTLRQDYIDRGIPEVYSMEYLNVPMDESTAYFRKADFLPLTAEDKKKKLNYYIAADLAISERDRADWSAFVVCGVDENKYIHIVNVIRERMDGLTIVNTMLALQRLYDPYAFGVEETQISKAIGPFLNTAMHQSNTYISLYPLKPYRQDKITRARSIQARMRAGGVKFDKGGEWYQTFEDECMTFPRARHDDQVDALAYIGLMIDKLVEANTVEEQADEDALEEQKMYGEADATANQTTGY
jgi:predicted phage terminase large subunit-like protein